MATVQRRQAGEVLSEFSAEEVQRGRDMYEKEAKNWPKPHGWDNMLAGSQYLWIQRAKGARR